MAPWKWPPASRAGVERSQAVYAQEEHTLCRPTDAHSVVRLHSDSSNGSRVPSRPYCSANRVTVDRVDAPVLA